MKLYCLLDYKNNFVSKYDSTIYRAGMDKILLKQYFSENQIKIEYLNFSKVQHYEPEFWKEKYIIYTSSEDIDYLYKSYVEDIIYYLEINGAKVIPKFSYLKANNNKVFMELLIKTMLPETRSTIKNKVFGCYEEVLSEKENLNYPQVYKQASGAMSDGVGLIKNSRELKLQLKKISRSATMVNQIKDKLRSLKHPGYIKESNYRKKFILQNFISNLDGDFKILIFSNNYYILKRGFKPQDFRASGSGIREFIKKIPDGLLDFAKSIFETLNVPNASIDIASNGHEFFLIEFQAIHFGTFTLMRSEFYWNLQGEDFIFTEGKSILEKEYAISVSNFIRV